MNFNAEAVKICLKQSDNFYLYDESIIRTNIDRLKNTFPQVEFLYSVKSNPHPHILRCVVSCGFGADAASSGEVKLSSMAGAAANDIYYSAPGKTMKDIEETFDHAVLIADSIQEIERIQAIAESRNITAEIGIRINPTFTFAGEGGIPSKFGIDEEQAAAFLQKETCPHIKIKGIHVHLKSQELKAEVLACYYKRMFLLTEKFDRLCGGLAFVNLGSGIGIPYEADDTPLNLDALGSVLNDEIVRYKSLHQNTKIIIEVGRYVSCKSGVYVTTVLDRKVSRGKTYLILKNTLNGFIRPSIARLVAHYSSEKSPLGSEPLFTSENAFQFLTLKDAAKETVTLVGNLCTATDVVAEDIVLPHLETGDVIIMTNAGSYAAVLSPMQFSSQERPREFFLNQNGVII